MGKHDFILSIIALIIKLLCILAVIVFSAWIIYIEHPGYLWMAVLVLLTIDGETIISVSNKENIKKDEGNDKTS